MAKKTKTAVKQAELDTNKLAEIVAATLAGSFVYVPVTEVEPLVLAELVETNPAMVDEHGSYATRATQKGIDTVNTATATETSTEVAAKAPRPVAPTFEVDIDVAVPTIKRGAAGRANLYPFDELPIGGSFHVAPTEAKPNPAKSLASTVSSATKRYADHTPPRKFIVRSVGADDPRGPGARVFRSE